MSLLPHLGALATQGRALGGALARRLLGMPRSHKVRL